jgi:hypothetical protein
MVMWMPQRVISESRYRPSILAWPAFLLIVLTIASELGVQQSAVVSQTSAKRDAAALAGNTAGAFSNKFLEATAALQGITSAVQVDAISASAANWTMVQSYLSSFISDLRETYPSIRLVTVSPQLITSLLVPHELMDSLKGSNQLIQGSSGGSAMNSLIFSKYPNDTVQGPATFQYSGW